MKQKIWIFIIEKKLSKNELENLLNDCKRFIQNWNSHEMPVNADVELYKDRLLIFKNDEPFNPIGGCATDNLFRYIQELENKYPTRLLNRSLIVFEKNNELLVENKKNLSRLIKSGDITADTIIYNTAISHSDEWEQFRKPLSESWVKNFIQTVEN